MRGHAREGGGGVSAVLEPGWIFWLLVLLAVAFARYAVLAVQDDDPPLAVAATVAFFLCCVAALMEGVGWL